MIEGLDLNNTDVSNTTEVTFYSIAVTSTDKISCELNNIWIPDLTAGTCSNPSFDNEEECQEETNTWFLSGTCSNPNFDNRESCESADEEDFIFNHEWIKSYTKAQTKFLWGTITGKYSQSLVGGASINFSDMKSEAEQEIQKLEEELLTKWSDPAPISIA
jgi:hypothetical protein